MGKSQKGNIGTKSPKFWKPQNWKERTQATKDQKP